MTRQYDVIVIGAGILGCCTAFELAKRGLRTLNVDTLPAAGYGSTSESCAIIRFHYSTADGVALAREGYYYWIDWPKYLGVVDEAGMARYLNTGCLVIKTEKNHDLAQVMASLDELKVGYEDLDAAAIQARFPHLDLQRFGPPVAPSDPRFCHPTGPAIRGAVYIPESGYINDPQLSCHNVQRAAEAKGGEFRFNARVVAILKSNGRVAGVKLADGAELHAPVVVNVSGPHSYLVNRMAGVEAGMKIKTRPLKQEVAHVPAPAGLDYNFQGFIVSDGDVGCYSRPEVGNNVLIGSEDPECDVLEYVDDPDTYDKSFSEQWRTQVMRKAQRISGLPIPSKRQGLVSLYDQSDDWLPIYDVSSLPGFYMAVGTSGNQYKNGPTVGIMMAELITRVEAGHDHDRDPVTFTWKFTRRTCNVGFFSRLREINTDSSFSVVG
jgi:sarcosine oxidase, subunit beta